MLTNGSEGSCDRVVRLSFTYNKVRVAGNYHPGLPARIAIATDHRPYTQHSKAISAGGWMRKKSDISLEIGGNKLEDSIQPTYVVFFYSCHTYTYPSTSTTSQSLRG